LADEFLPKLQEKLQRSPLLDGFDGLAIDARCSAVAPNLSPSHL
jgi:hypothetical protein